MSDGSIFCTGLVVVCPNQIGRVREGEHVDTRRSKSESCTIPFNGILRLGIDPSPFYRATAPPNLETQLCSALHIQDTHKDRKRQIAMLVTRTVITVSNTSWLRVLAKCPTRMFSRAITPAMNSGWGKTPPLIALLLLVVLCRHTLSSGFECAVAAACFCFSRHAVF